MSLAQELRVKKAEAFASGHSALTCGREPGTFCSVECGPDPMLWGHGAFDDQLECESCGIGLVEFRTTMMPCVGRRAK